MRSSDLDALLRDKLNDPDGLTWQQPERYRWLNLAHRESFGILVREDPSYYNFSFEVLSSEAYSMTPGFGYQLPGFVYAVTDVREGSASNTPGNRIPHAVNLDQRGWMFEAGSVLRLIETSAKTLRIFCAKVPARLTTGTLPAQTSMSSTQMRLDQDSVATLPHELEVNAYANAVFEITSPQARAGQRRQCATSAPLESFSSNQHTVLTFGKAWSAAPAADDTYDMHSELSDAHAPFVVSRAAEMCFQKVRNAEALKLISAEVARNYNRLIEAITPRQYQDPTRWSLESDSIFRRDPDLEPL